MSDVNVSVKCPACGTKIPVPAGTEWFNWLDWHVNSVTINGERDIANLERHGRDAGAIRADIARHQAIPGAIL